MPRGTEPSGPIVPGGRQLSGPTEQSRRAVLGRRTGGIIVLVAVILGSLLVARIGGTRVAGTAIPQPGLGAPTVGECVMSIVGPAAGPLAIAVPPSPVSVATVGESAATFAPCTEPHVGEVVAYLSLASTSVTTAHSPPPTSDGTPAGSAAEPTAAAAAAAVSDGQWCQMVAGTYRDQTSARYGNGSDGLWHPSIGQRFVAILSAPTLDPAGPRWAACALLSPGLELYSGSYVRSLANLPAPAPFGLCRTGEPADHWVSCTAAHRVQDFGTTLGQGVSPDEALVSCQFLIKRMTRMQDITNGGLLRVDVVDFPAGSVNGGTFGTPDPDGPSSAATCRLSVVGSGQLVGTLIGLGDRPLPLG